MYMELFKSIEYSIQIRRENNRNLFRWELPRRVGATTWIESQILKDLLDDKKVAYISTSITIRDARLKNIFKPYLDSKQLSLIVSSNYNIMRGHSYDRIYGDNVMYPYLTRDEEYKLQSCIHTIVNTNNDRYAVMINTTEG